MACTSSSTTFKPIAQATERRVFRFHILDLDCFVDECFCSEQAGKLTTDAERVQFDSSSHARETLSFFHAQGVTGSRNCNLMQNLVPSSTWSLRRITSRAARADSGETGLCVNIVPGAVSIILMRHTQCEDTSLVRAEILRICSNCYEDFIVI